MAVEVICTIASRASRIVGSGTFSTCTVLRPDQTFALIGCRPPPASAPPPGPPGAALLQLRLGNRRRRPLPQLALDALSLRRRVGSRDRAGLHQLLEVAQVVL